MNTVSSAIQSIVVVSSAIQSIVVVSSAILDHLWSAAVRLDAFVRGDVAHWIQSG